MANYADLSRELTIYFKNLENPNQNLIVSGPIKTNDEWQIEEYLRVFKDPLTDAFHVAFPNEHGKEITDESLKKEHQSLAILYNTIKEHNNKNRKKNGEKEIVNPPINDVNSTLGSNEIPVFQYQKLPRTKWQKLLLPLTFINSALKWLANFLILDNFISKYTVGKIIAAVANHGNPHYKTGAHSITETLGPLIFPAGLKKPQITNDGHILLDQILYPQFVALHRFNNQYKEDEKAIKLHNFKIQIDKNTVISGVTANNDLANNLPENSPHLHIIYFNGNSGCYQDDSRLVERDLVAYENDYKIPVTAIQFNYPGILNSSGKVRQADDLVQAGIANVERLNKQYNIPYDKIGLHGVSLGGSIASHVASYYHSRGVSLAGTYASKTFASTTEVGLSYLKKVPYVGPLFSFFFRPLVEFGVWGAGWRLNTAEEFTKVPEQERDYSVVRSDKTLRNSYQPLDDAVLVHSASLHDSWRLRLTRSFHKHGLFGYDKETYRVSNRARKMVVVQKDDDNLPFIFNPMICGHSEVNFNHGKTGLFLFHRGCEQPDIEVLLPETANKVLTEKKSLRLTKESGSVARGFFATPACSRAGNKTPAAEIIRSVIGTF